MNQRIYEFKEQLSLQLDFVKYYFFNKFIFYRKIYYKF